MCKRFTDHARKVMQLSNQEARHFGHDYIGTEHILLGLLKQSSGVQPAELGMNVVVIQVRAFPGSAALTFGS